MYKLVRRILFLFPAEAVHSFSMSIFRLLCKIRPAKRTIARISAVHEFDMQKEIFGLRFKNPLGLAAGFDKNAIYLDELQTLGFGFVEIGTVTPLAQDGNKKPRLFRLPKDRALINRMGFNNDGAKKIAERLRRWKNKQAKEYPVPMIIGGNIGKNKNTANEQAWKDYVACFVELSDCVDYFVINLSSPNTPGLRELQEKSALRKILSELQKKNQEISELRSASLKPLLVKLAPDLSPGLLDDIIDLALEMKLDGLVASNTTVGRIGISPKSRQRVEKIGAGGLSGAPLKELTTQMIRYIYQKTKGSLAIIGSGGVFDGADAMEKMTAGASLVQLWTGFIYEGPFIVPKILKGIS